MGLGSKKVSQREKLSVWISTDNIMTIPQDVFKVLWGGVFSHFGDSSYVSECLYTMKTSGLCDLWSLMFVKQLTWFKYADTEHNDTTCTVYLYFFYQQHKKVIKLASGKKHHIGSSYLFLLVFCKIFDYFLLCQSFYIILL